MRILLVEDDDPTRDMITQVLKRLDPNFDIDAATNGDDALTRYLDSFHDLVITDNAHPGMHGIELIELILERHPRQSIILQTGNAGEHIEAFRQTHREIPFLEKPYRLRHLQDFVSAVLNQPGGCS